MLILKRPLCLQPRSVSDALDPMLFCLVYLVCTDLFSQAVKNRADKPTSDMFMSTYTEAILVEMARFAQTVLISLPEVARQPLNPRPTASLQLYSKLADFT